MGASGVTRVPAGRKPRDLHRDGVDHRSRALVRVSSRIKPLFLAALFHPRARRYQSLVVTRARETLLVSFAVPLASQPRRRARGTCVRWAACVSRAASPQPGPSWLYGNDGWRHSTRSRRGAYACVTI